jgi:diaminopimelate epimerase
MTARMLPFSKMNGLGNEIVVIDLRTIAHTITAAQVQALAGRDATRFDQLMVLDAPRTAGTEAFIRIYNADGSEAGACGNGMRCVALIESQRTGKANPAFQTAGGVLATTVTSTSDISIDMGEPHFEWDRIPLSEPFKDTRHVELQIGPIDAPVLHSPSVVNVGNPHAIFWVDDVTAYDLARFGPLLENHPLFPQRANISLAQVTARDALTLRTWERGAGLTQACGSAACAAAISAARLKLTDRTVHVTLPGGSLTITWTANNRIIMTGPATFEYAGEIDVSALSQTA